MNIHQEIKNITRDQFIYGCGNHGCLYKKVQGQGTNAPCSCGQAIASKVINFIIENKKEFLDQISYIESK
jgi:hypothetical protein